MNHRYTLTEISAPPAKDIPADIVEFLSQLVGPTLIRVAGRDRSRCRAVCTLLHGNEPSGAKAIHRFLREGSEPATDLLLFLVSVATALTEPVFQYRHLPDERDMNRCFAPPFDDAQGRLAGRILDILEESAPEAVVDIHNTSGNGPSFVVCAEDEVRHGALAARFSPRLVITDIRLGAILEQSRPERPVVTVECGGAGDDNADEVAWQGLKAFVGADHLFNEPGEGLDVYHHPVRVEVAAGTAIAYADEPRAFADITLPTHIDRRNFGIVTPDVPLAWVDDPSCLQVRAARGDLPLAEYLTVEEGRLFPAVPLKLFMVTTNPVIAGGDCLFYAVKESAHDTP